MTACPSCMAADAYPPSGLYHAGCAACDARALAASPEFGRVMAMQRMTPEWSAMLGKFAGPEKADREALHQRVKAAYIRRMQRPGVTS